MTDLHENSIVDSSSAGATIQSIYIGRKANVYALYDTEIEHLSNISASTTISFSLSSFMSALAFGIWTNAAFSEKLTAEGSLLSRFAAPLLLIFAVAYLLRAFYLQKLRKNYWNNIKDNAKLPGQ